MHKRLGHVGIERIAKLSEMIEGITIEGNLSKREVGMWSLSIGRCSNVDHEKKNRSTVKPGYNESIETQ